MTRWAAIAAGVWAGCGVLALLGLQQVIRTPITDGLLLWPAMVVSAFRIGGGLTDAAHGPPFLTVRGITVLYLVPPAIAAGVLYLRARAGAAR